MYFIYLAFFQYFDLVKAVGYCLTSHADKILNDNGTYILGVQEVGTFLYSKLLYETSWTYCKMVVQDMLRRYELK